MVADQLNTYIPRSSTAMILTNTWAPLVLGKHSNYLSEKYTFIYILYISAWRKLGYLRDLSLVTTSTKWTSATRPRSTAHTGSSPGSVWIHEFGAFGSIVDMYVARLPSTALSDVYIAYVEICHVGLPSAMFNSNGGPVDQHKKVIITNNSILVFICHDIDTSNRNQEFDWQINALCIISMTVCYVKTYLHEFQFHKGTTQRQASAL